MIIVEGPTPPRRPEWEVWALIAGLRLAAGDPTGAEGVRALLLGAWMDHLLATTPAQRQQGA